MQSPFAVMEVLAMRPDGRGTLDDVLQEIELLQEMKAANGRDTPQRFSELDRIDIVKAGLVAEEGDGLRITEAGRSVLRALDALSNPAPKPQPLEQSQSLQVIDNLIGKEMRLKIFDLGLRMPGESLDQDGPNIGLAQAQPGRDQEIDFVHQPTPEPDQINEEPADADDHLDASDIDIAPDERNARAFRGRDLTSPQAASRASGQPSALASNLKRFGGILRGHLEQETPNIRTARGGGIGGLVLSVLALLVIILCAGTYIAVTQIKSLKSEITTLERKLVPPKKEAASPEPPEKRDGSEQKNASVSGTDKSKPPAPPSQTPLLLTLSADEMRLVRDYIKPAPTAKPAQSINVGDPVTSGTIPLPSALTDKIPKLLGGRFTIRNGAIIILKRDSHQADVVLAPN